MRGPEALRTCVCADVDRLRANTAIDLNILVREPGAQFRHFRHAALQELLSASACTERSQQCTTVLQRA